MADNIGTEKSNVIRFKIIRKFSDWCGFSDSVNTYNEDNWLFMFKRILIIFYVKSFRKKIYQIFPAVFGFFDMLNLYKSFNLFNDFSGSQNSDISHNENFFKFFIKVVVNLGKSVKNTVKAIQRLILVLMSPFLSFAKNPGFSFSITSYPFSFLRPLRVCRQDLRKQEPKHPFPASLYHKVCQPVSSFLFCE